MDSLEEKVCVFMHESELDRSLEEDLWCSENSSSDSDDPPENTSYWESQMALLQEILDRYHLKGLKLRQEADQIIKEVKASEFCSCLKPNSSNCTTCLRRRVVDELSDKGFRTNLCISKWGATEKFLGGSHEYIEVVASTLKRKKQMSFLIELEFRDQFEIVKAGEEYQKLVSCLPESYVGKADYLTSIVRVMCGAAKKSLKEKKMHRGPWRKSSFMRMKWSGFNQTWNSDKSLAKFSLQQASDASCLRISGAPSAVIVT